MRKRRSNGRSVSSRSTVRRTDAAAGSARARLATTTTLALALAVAPAAVAGPCDAHFRFDGNLEDAGANAYHGELVVSGGEPSPNPAQYAPGKFGQALVLDGETVMFSPLNLQTETCPQVTISGWVYLEQHPPNNYLVSTGYGRGPKLLVRDHHYSTYAGSDEIRVHSAVRQGQWIFLAATWDYEAGVQRAHWRHRFEEETFQEQTRPPQDGFWVGGNAYFTSLNSIAKGVLLDDLRVWGRVLTEQELREVQAAGDPSLTACDCDGASGDSGGSLDHLRPDPLPLDVPIPGDDPGDGGDGSEGSGGGEGTGGSGDAESSGSSRADSDRGDGSLDHLGPDPLPLDLPDGDSTPPDGDEGDDPPGEPNGSGLAPGEEAPATGTPRPTGERAYSSLAGNTGGNKRMLDLGDAFMQSIWWSEKTDRPCYMRVNGFAGDTPRHKTLELGCSLGLKFHP